MYRTELTKEMLIEWGIVDVSFKGSKMPTITRNWYTAGKRTNKSKKVLQELKISDVVCKHKYTKDKVYPAVAFSIGNKTKTITIGRLVYVWYNGNIPAGDYDVDHKNADSYDNRPDNLQLLSRSENLAKRYTDNPANHVNQYR